MAERLHITGNGVTFTDAGDLTTETHDAILAAFLAEIERKDITDPTGGYAEGMKAAARAVAKVEEAALATGWTCRCAALLGVAAGDIYGRLLAETAREMKP